MDITKSNICDCLSFAFNGLKKCKLNLEKISEDAKAAINRLSDFYRISENEAVLLIIAIEAHYSSESTHNIVGFREIRETIDCDVMKVIPFKNQILSLIEKHFFFREYSLDENMNFRINNQVLEALYRGSFAGITDVGEDFNDRYAFIRRFQDMYEDRGSYPHSLKVYILSDMEDSFSSIDLVEKMRVLIPVKEERFMFYDCCGDFLQGRISGLIATVNDIYNDIVAKRKAKSMADGNHFLIEQDFLKVDKGESISDSRIDLTDKAKEILLGEDLCLYEKKFSARDMIEPEKINEVKLFYSRENQKQVDTLAEYLSPVHFRNIQESLKTKGMKIGFSVLLHGAPGTGKTETVYQIARKTGRRIVKVDVSKSKSCWFGESEKLVKDIFDRYKAVCKKAVDTGENIPILLFNEADAIFSKRKDVSTGNVAQTENTIQNIILDEMENLEGILIATTNLTDNFDSAFERRFLYKIRFDLPTDEARFAIWESRICSLPLASLNSLAKHELSGGQIDNIVRKATMNEILTGEVPCLEKLEELCSEEKISDSSTGSRIGFCTCA